MTEREMGKDMNTWQIIKTTYIHFQRTNFNLMETLRWVVLNAKYWKFAFFSICLVKLKGSLKSCQVCSNFHIYGMESEMRKGKFPCITSSFENTK